ncbi:Spermidine/putrescine import ATP-binding protein PotA [Candidatus Desulfosporosinus infrequens]|uniref:ABC-type quaternary amine transporter n=1 Tax=Candidatus Desulfosporosinus infrequens TaxID=2043169 RepID=A0A2U3LHV2_9FIRM|nr:Spermidine/putrescine import ATP-binding protein PotA [Candidatus Desulfosporosinus infrequens]
MLLDIQGIEKTFDKVAALKSINLTIQKGKFTTLLGPSGCGKTTLLRILAGLETPDTGEIHMENECLFSRKLKVNKPIHLRNFGMVFQDFALWPHMTVFENIAFGLKATGQKKDLKKHVLEAIEMVRLQGMEHRYPHQLSGGQQQRVAFARAVVMKPKLVLFDEPLSALDALLRDEMRIELINLVRNIGLTAVYVTHDQTEALAMSDEIVVMNKGEILQIGSPERIYRTPVHPFVARFIGKSNWVLPDKQLVRPEQIHLEPFDSKTPCVAYEGIVKSTSYVGDRYEILVDMASLGTFTVYFHMRIQNGERVKLYVKTQDIHEII